MINLITNMYLNNGVYNVELRDEKLEKINIRVNEEDMKYKLGDFVKVIFLNNSKKYMIDEKIIKPTNFLDFYPRSKYTKEELEKKIISYVNEITDKDYLTIIKTIFEKDLYFFEYPAAKSIHHAYIGGLAEHTINILELATPLIPKYDLDKNLLYTAALLHDYAKTRELDAYGLTYTVEGNLLGHLVMIVEEIVRVCVEKKIDERKLNIIALKHALLSHHGILEYGSPKEPMIKEAYILSQLDEIDAKMNVLEKSLDKVNENTISGPLMGFDKRRFLRLNLGDSNE